MENRSIGLYNTVTWISRWIGAGKSNPRRKIRGPAMMNQVETRPLVNKLKNSFSKHHERPAMFSDRPGGYPVVNTGERPDGA